MFKVGDLVADASERDNIGFVTKVDDTSIYFQFLNGKNAGKSYVAHYQWLISVKDINRTTSEEEDWY
jgi:hypothetical protein